MGTRRRGVQTRQVARSCASAKGLCRPFYFRPIRHWTEERQSPNFVLFCVKANANEIAVQCIGQNYALNEVTLFLVRLLQRFDEFEIDERKQLPPPWKKDPTADIGLKDPRSGTKRKDIERIWPGFTIIIHINGGLWTKFRKASE